MAVDISKPKSPIGSVFELPGKSWEIVKQNWQLFAVVNIMAILSGISGVFDNQNDTQQDPQWLNDLATNSFAGGELAAIIGAGVIVALLFGLVALFFASMGNSLELRTSKAEKPVFNDIFQTGKKFFVKYVLLMLLTGLLILVGLVLLIVPGVIIFVRTIFAPYLMFEKNLGVVDSLKASNEMVKANSGPVWRVVGLVVLIGLAGGLISAVPYIGGIVSAVFAVAVSLVVVLRYRQMQGKTI